MTDAPDLTGVVITVQDCVDAGHCGTGIYAWMQEHIQGGARRVWKDGVPAAEMWETGDGYGREVVTHTLNKRAQESADG